MITKRFSLDKTYSLTILTIAFIGLIAFSCNKESSADVTRTGENLPAQISAQGPASSADFMTNPGGLQSETLAELQIARAATAKYNNIQNAFDDHYEDIGLILPNMGYHFLNSGLVDSVFDPAKPELLVYNKKANGNFELVAVEYAVAIDFQHPEKTHIPPAGFTGDADEWDFNTLNTGLWTLHAWIWKPNPDGVFKMMNPLVIVN